MKDLGLDSVKKNVLNWLEQQSAEYILMDSNQYGHDRYAKYEWLLFWGFDDQFSVFEAQKEDLINLQNYLDLKKGAWLTGWVNYDVKNCIHNLQSTNRSLLNTPDIFFSKPAHVVAIDKDGQLYIYSDQYDLDILMSVVQIDNIKSTAEDQPDLLIEPRTTTANYKNNIKSIKNDIINGLYYELNYCQSFTADVLDFPSVSIFQQLNEQTLAPFSTLIRMAEHDVLCFSPERFFCTRGHQLISQPIKGTIGAGDTKDQSIQNEMILFHSEKDRAENVMIVDLVRNDMTKCCKPGSITVEELFGVYPFKNVIHLISTVTGNLMDDISLQIC